MNTTLSELRSAESELDRLAKEFGGPRPFKWTAHGVQFAMCHEEWTRLLSHGEWLALEATIQRVLALEYAIEEGVVA